MTFAREKDFQCVFPYFRRKSLVALFLTDTMFTIYTHKKKLFKRIYICVVWFITKENLFDMCVNILAISNSNTNDNGILYKNNNKKFKMIMLVIYLADTKAS